MLLVLCSSAKGLKSKDNDNKLVNLFDNGPFYLHAHIWGKMTLLVRG